MFVFVLIVNYGSDDDNSMLLNESLNISAGLLFAYNPFVNPGKGGQPRPHHIVTHGKNYQQMFSTLLHEVQIFS